VYDKTTTTQSDGQTTSTISVDGNTLNVDNSPADVSAGSRFFG